MQITVQSLMLPKEQVGLCQTICCSDSERGHAEIRVKTCKMVPEAIYISAFEDLAFRLLDRLIGCQTAPKSFA
ncbi:hypothetical protein [Acaryochloris marina]|uniref:Uncharacterized protein n=1 Tax=Acaryochloris marina (strain MBIC 11017) TaxID=329726 RepID=A8ZQH1_ACAM1|nr:hypothetical protein [Acaryochloris marina]ABW33257.1 hypothetical protein AM1_G0077 [Acaryochloris marina MBIC11017]